MKRILCILLICSHFLFGADYFKPERISLPIKMQTLVGETAINNVLMSYFSGSHEIAVDNIGNLVLTVNNVGIDIRGKDDVVFGYDLVLAPNFLSELSDIAGGVIRGEMPIRGAVSLQELKDAYVVVMDLSEVVGKILEQYHITNSPIVSSLKSFFSPSKGMVELWRQKYSTLLDAYVNKLEKNLDLAIVEKELALSIGEIEDNISLDLKLRLESERQYFWIDGLVKNSDVLNICSNKDFKLLKSTFQIMPNHSLAPIVERCKGENNDYQQCFDLRNLCKEDLYRITHSINANDFTIGVTVRTKQGGIVTVDGEVR